MDALFQSYNWFFWIPIGLATLFILMQVLGLGFSALGAELDLDVAGDVEVGDLDFGSDGIADADLEISPILQLFHIGKVPLSIILTLFFYGFGFGGLLSIALIIEYSEFSDATQLIFFGLSGALVSSVLLTRFGGSILGRLIPSIETKSMNAVKMLGKIAEVDSAEVTTEAGRGHLIDHAGDFHTLFLRLNEQTEQTVLKGSKVEIVRYRAKTKTYICRPLRENQESG